jgi:U3 small nucleolar RNA-associated protein 22
MAKALDTDSVLSIDMVVIMPTSVLQEKDYLNYRYFYKRAYYLACIAAGLQDAAQDEFAIKFKYLNDNDLHPVLCITSKSGKVNTPGSKIANANHISGEGKPRSRFEINIIPAAPIGFFNQSKLLPSKNSIRPKEGTEDAALPATPFYNSSLCSDLNYEPYLKIIHSAAKQSEGFSNAVILGRIWLHKRNLGGCLSRGGFGNFEWAALMALLLKGGGPKSHSVLSPGYSSYQMFKAMLQFIATGNMANKPFMYDCANVNISKSDNPVFFDGPRGQNILYKMTSWSYGLLRDEARISLDMLNNETFDQFESTFVLKASEPLQRYDCILHLPLSAKILTRLSSCDHISPVAIYARRVYDVLLEGLMDRVKLIHVVTPASQKWSVKSSSREYEEPLLVSFVFDPATIDRVVDHGPSADEKSKAAKFQKFWGEKAELRRFKDGSILETLVWSSKTTYSIFQEVTAYIIGRHFEPATSDGLVFIGESFAKLVPFSDSSAQAFDDLKQAFLTFEKDIRALEGLPLQLKQLSAIDPQLRGSSILPSVFGPSNPMRIPADVLIQFEGSGRWPDDVIAIQRTKIAFLLKIGALLKDANDSVDTRVGLENEESKFQNCAFLDVRYNSGAIFRLRIHNDREQTLLEHILKDKFTDSRTREDAVLALSTYKRTFVQLPVLTQSIATHCTRFPLLSPTIRLVKLWCEHHMLSGHVSGELIELIVSRIFMLPYPWRIPSSVMSGFLRTLMFIARWDWRHQPLVVDFTGTMTTKDVDAANTRLEAWRKIDPGMNRTVIFASSNHDASGVAFTDQGPSKVGASRMTSLANSAYQLVKESGLSLDPRALFATSTADYDFVIHISSNFSSDGKPRSSSKSKFKNLAVQSEGSFEGVGYEAVQLFISESKISYASSVVLFHGNGAVSHIGGLWNPHSLSARPFRINLSYATTISKGQDDSALENVEVDKYAILSEIARLGGDMVSNIEVRR